MGQYLTRLLNFKKAYDSVRKELGYYTILSLSLEYPGN
jgi:hypothetical protein